MADLTIILVLYDRGDYYHYPFRWMKFASKYLNKYKIFIADGSGKATVQDLFNDKKNFKDIDYEYYKYPKDQNYNDYFSKLDNILSKVKTEFSILTDDDDFLSYKGIDTSIEFLKNNKKFSTSRGIIGSFVLNENKDFNNFNISRFKIPKISQSLIYDSAIERYLKRIRGTYYDVHRSHFHKENHHLLNKNNFKELTMVEMLTESLDVINGKIHRHKELYGMRQANFNNSSHTKFTKEKGSVLNRLVFGDLNHDCKKWLIIVSEAIANTEKIAFEEAKQLVKEDYLHNLEKHFNKNLKQNKNYKLLLKSIVPNFIKSININLNKSASNKQFYSLLTKNKFLQNIDDHIKENHK